MVAATRASDLDVGLIQVKGQFISGQWVQPFRRGSIDVFDAFTGRVLGSAPDGGAEDVEAATAAAAAALPGWAALAGKERAAYLRTISKGIAARREEISQLISREVGTSIGLSRILQTTTPIHSFANAADLAESYAFEAIVDNSLVLREPVGVVGAITAWNFPLHLASLKVAFALAAGCTVVLKPSELAPLSVKILGEILAQANLPAGVVNIVFGTGVDAGEPLVNSPHVSMISFTGSTRAGKRIGELASKQVKRVALELGGKSPSIILDDADLTAAVTTTVHNCFSNTGQMCNALTRLVVPRSLALKVEKIAKSVAESLSVGDPLLTTTFIGPVISEQQRKRVFDLIQSGIDQGAKLVTGGLGPVEGYANGFFIRPTVFSDVTPDMRLHREEVFGPVLSIESYDTEDEAVALANDSVYGLQAAVWSADATRASNIARRLEVGMVDINGGPFNPLAPYGGRKQSGIGREFGVYGLEEFLEYKTIQRLDGARAWF